MGYVNKAQDAKYEAQARSGYVAAQTITSRLVAQGKDNTAGADGTAGALTAAVKPSNIAKELGEATTGETITKSGCVFDGTKIKACAFTVNGYDAKAVVFRANPTADQEPTEMLPITSNKVTVDDDEITLLAD